MDEIAVKLRKSDMELFMMFCPLKKVISERKLLRKEYKTAKVTGVVRLGQDIFFFRQGLKVYYITYEEIMKCFRRVMVISAGAEKGNMKLETLVIADDERELAQIQLPGADAAKILLEELKVKMPHADFNCPSKAEEDNK